MKKTMKKLAFILMATLTLLSTALGAVSVSAYGNDISVALDGRVLEFDVPPQIVNGRTMVPMRAIFEELGATVEWEAEDRTIYAYRGDQVVIMQIDSNLMMGADEESTFVRYLDAAPVIVNSRTLIPARAVSEALQCDVDWIADYRRVVITSGKGEKMEDVYYPHSEFLTVDVPTYDCVTGATCIEKEIDETGAIYSYTINNSNEVATYIAALTSVYGFEAEAPESDETSTSWFLKHENGESYMMVTYYEGSDNAEVWVFLL